MKGPAIRGSLGNHVGGLLFHKKGGVVDPKNSIITNPTSILEQTPKKDQAGSLSLLRENSRPGREFMSRSV